ncbi:hypothetical protein LP52_15620 [Streptomonospora alba]|uniref:Uncharacterized protein n=1 Tax=Streptomonospora alba TaxID=183763 RepID=A0A0C2J9E9_9ACTN|nr:hypothetical protein LP52_15620 [Streptomonospora alba]
MSFIDTAAHSSRPGRMSINHSANLARLPATVEQVAHPKTPSQCADVDQAVDAQPPAGLSR